MNYKSAEDEIYDLHRVFGYAVDARDFDLVRSLYTDDAIEEHGFFDGPVDAYIAWARDTLSAFETTVHLYEVPITTISGDVAESLTRSRVFLRVKAEPSYNSLSVCRHIDRYRRTPQGWRFSHRTLAFEWGQDFPPNAQPASGPQPRVYDSVPGASSHLLQTLVGAGERA